MTKKSGVPAETPKRCHNGDRQAQEARRGGEARGLRAAGVRPSRGPEHRSRETREEPAGGGTGLPAERHGLSPPLAGSDMQVAATGLHPRPCTPLTQEAGVVPSPWEAQTHPPEEKRFVPGTLVWDSWLLTHDF